MLEDRREERGLGRRRGVAERQARPAEVVRPGEPPARPVDDLRTHLRPVPDQGGQRRGLRPCGNPWRGPRRRRAARSRRRRGSGRRDADVGDGVVQRGDEVGDIGPRIVRSRERVERGHADAEQRVGEERVDALEQDRVAEPPDGVEAGDPACLVGFVEQLLDDADGRIVVATGQHRVGHGGADGRAVVGGEPGHGRDGAGRIVGEDGHGGERPDRGRPDAPDPRRTGAPRTASATGASPPSIPIASSAATRTPGSGSARTPASDAAASGESVPPSSDAAIRRTPGSGASRAWTRATAIAGSRVRAASPGPPSRTCSPRPARSVRSRLVPYRRRMPTTTIVHAIGRDRAQPEDLVARQHGAGRDQEQPREDRPDLAGNAVVEGEDLRAPLRGDDVVERAPGRIRQPALGDLLREPEERRRWSSRTRRSRSRTRRGRPAAGPGRHRRRRTGHRRGWRPAGTRRTRWP